MNTVIKPNKPCHPPVNIPKPAPAGIEVPAEATRYGRASGIYRLLCVAFSATAIVGYAYGKSGFHVFLGAALIAAVAAKDVTLTSAVVRMFRIVWTGQAGTVAVGQRVSRRHAARGRTDGDGRQRTAGARDAHKRHEA